MMDIRSRPRTINSTTGTKDLQMVNISLRVLYRPKIDMLAVIVKTLGMEYEGIVFGRTQDGQDGVGRTCDPVRESHLPRVGTP